jgi:tetratricopeptide (TPR) repeat protein
MKNYVSHILTIALLLLAHFSWAQELPITQRAIQQCVDRKYDQALTTIDQAVRDADEKDHPRTWYVKSFIHKELYKTRKTIAEQERELELIKVAIDKSIELDPYQEEWAQNKEMLIFLYVQYHTKARDFALSQNEVSYEHVDSLFAEYIRIRKLAEPENDLSGDLMNFYKIMGQKYHTIWSDDPNNRMDALNLSERYFKKALEVNPLDCDGNYNLVVGMYNLGVLKIKQLNSTSDITELILTQEESIKLFKKALPILHTAYDQCPTDIAIVRAMFHLYRALDREEESQRYSSELEALLKRQP